MKRILAREEFHNLTQYPGWGAALSAQDMVGIIISVTQAERGTEEPRHWPKVVHSLFSGLHCAILGGSNVEDADLWEGLAARDDKALRQTPS